MSTHLDEPPRIFFPSGLLNEMATTPAAAKNAISYISRIRNVYFGSFSGTCTEVAAKATDSWSMTDMTSQPLLTPVADVDHVS
eukprot:SAG25_NODE_9260_length_380_cov_1.459075_1_plen_83_part_00